MAINPYLNEISAGDLVHDYQHASRVFRTDAFRLHPKFQFLYYVRINLNQEFTMMVGNKQKEIGALVKSVDLPKFTIDTKTLNAYNRVNIVQTKIKYDPVIIKFHDDAADIIREFWYDYYSFYYRDSDHPTSLYQSPHKYSLRQTDKWGYTLRTAPNGTQEQTSPVTQLITDIQIFSFHAKRFSEVTLHNPIITNFRHGQHDYAQGSGLLEHEMSVAFETVTYASGDFTQDQFGADMLLKYDTTPSDLSPKQARSISVDGRQAKGTDLMWRDGKVSVAGGQPVYYRGGGRQSQNGFALNPGSSSMQKRNSNSVFSTIGQTLGITGGGGAAAAFNTQGGGTTSQFGRAAQSIVGGMVASAIRGRNPLSQFNVNNASSLLYQAGSAVGGPLGQKITATGGLVRAGQTISRNGVGPGNFGAVAVAINALNTLGVRPENILNSGRNIFSNQASTNGSPVARQSGSFPTNATANFPSINAPVNNQTSSYNSPRFTDNRPTTINDSAAILRPSNQGRPDAFRGTI